jgi:hypothetical protein
MPQEIQAVGYIGLAFEATAGTYTAPTKGFPIASESLKYSNNDKTRRLIRGIADALGQIAGPFHIEGDISMEFLPDVIPYFMYASRNTVVKTGTNPYTYVGTPGHAALPNSGRTLSITVVRNGVAFGYTGCVVSGLSANTDDGVLMATASIVGRNETDQSVFAQTYVNQLPFSHGMYTIGVPTGSTVTDVDTFSFSLADAAEAQNRLTNTRAATFVKFGEREVTLAMTKDFTGRTEYDQFKALTSKSVRVKADNGASASVQITLPNTTMTAYDISGLSGQGDLVMADVTYQGFYDPTTSKSYEISVTTTENIT